LCAIT